MVRRWRISCYCRIHPSTLLRYADTVIPVFSGLCDQRTPAVSGQYNDVRGDFLYKLPRDQRRPANADADRHFVVIFAPQPADSCRTAKRNISQNVRT